MAAASVSISTDKYSIAWFPSTISSIDEYTNIKPVVSSILCKITDETEQYNNGTTTEDDFHEMYKDTTRIQSAYRTFQAWCQTPPLSQKVQMFAYLLKDTYPVIPDPDTSKWAYEAHKMDPITDEEMDTLQAGHPDDTEILRPEVFYTFVARTWRLMNTKQRKPFYAVAAIRTLSVASLWVEHHWDLDHPQGEQVRENEIVPEQLAPFQQKFGFALIDGPRSPESLVRDYAYTPQPEKVNIPNWNIVMHRSHYKFSGIMDKTSLFFYDRFDRVFFYIYLPTPYWNAMQAYDILVKVEQTPSKTRVTRTPSLPSTLPRVFSDDILDSYAASHASQTDIGTLATIIYQLHADGLIVAGDYDAEQAFIREYREFCKE